MTIESVDLRKPVWVDCDPGIDDAFALVASALCTGLIGSDSSAFLRWAATWM